MSAAMVFMVPMPPNIANGRMHWRAKHNARTAYYAYLDNLLMAQRLPSRPARPLEAASVASTMTLHNRMDHDNAMARHKWLLDWLESRGYIQNDRDMDWIGLPKQIIDRSTASLIELTVTPR